MTVRLPRPDTPVLRADGAMSYQWLKSLTATNDAVNGVISATIYHDTGTVNAMVIASGATALTRGLVRYLTPAFTNTSNVVTLNDSSLGAKPVIFPDSSLPAVGQIVVGVTLQVIFDGTSWEIQSQAPANQAIPGSLTVAGTLGVTGATTLTGGVTGAMAATGAVSGTSVTASTYLKSGSSLVSGLPSAVTAGAGARAFVTDATNSGFGNAVIGTGANKMPVWSDGTVWLIG